MPLGTIIGDIIGSRFESKKEDKAPRDFELFAEKSRFTDDTVLTLAVCDSMVHDKPIHQNLQAFYHKYPKVGYGSAFADWSVSCSEDRLESWGNGSAMRISPVGFACNDINTILKVAEGMTVPSHNHPDSIKGAQAIAVAILFLRQGLTKKQLKISMKAMFNIDIPVSIDDLVKTHTFEITCKGTVPIALACFMESDDFESTMRNAICIGGDTDTNAAIAGGLAHAHYGIDDFLVEGALKYLDDFLIKTLEEFYNKYSTNEEGLHLRRFSLGTQ